MSNVYRHGFSIKEAYLTFKRLASSLAWRTFANFDWPYADNALYLKIVKWVKGVA